jgi:hypothetical protein
MKALISTNEPCETGYRVADTHPTGFDVHSSLFWVDCSDDVVADLFWYDPEDQTIKERLIFNPSQPQPETEGTQEL